jgi:AraC-like DNA-binding protein
MCSVSCPQTYAGWAPPARSDSPPDSATWSMNRSTASPPWDKKLTNATTFDFERSFAPADAAAQQLWRATVSYVKDVVLADDTLATPVVLGIAGSLLAAVTMSSFPNTAIAHPIPDDSNDQQPVLLRRAIEFIEANADKNIGLGDITETVCLTPRAVQYMFRRHLDTTPLQYLRRIRLHNAHHELLAADRRHDSVAAIAARWGFMHTSRFAVFYRQTYGRSPHITLRSGQLADTSSYAADAATRPGIPAGTPQLFAYHHHGRRQRPHERWVHAGVLRIVQCHCRSAGMV